MNLIKQDIFALNFAQAHKLYADHLFLNRALLVTINVMLALWMGTFVAELVLFTLPVAWRCRRVISPLLVVAVLVTTIGLVQGVGLGNGVLLAFLGLYRIGNIFRIIKARMHSQYLKCAIIRTSLGLFFIHTLLISAVILPLALDPKGSWRILQILQLLVASTFMMVTAKNIQKLKFKMPQKYLTDSELPTVTVAIPARNETNQLQECLTSLLMNDYPKMEIIVLDDCSQRPTAQIIKDFAHEGVRFVHGLEPADRWLAKNQAYQKLYQEATGDLLLFCGVDAHFSAQSIRAMVNLMYNRNKSMLSVLPMLTVHTSVFLKLQSLQSWWLLALPRRLFNRPPVSNTCWIIGRRDLKKLGGFSAVSHSVLPESYFARELTKTDQYCFVRCYAELQVQTTKNYYEQYATAIRTQYPMLRRRPENVLILSIFSTIFLLGPFVGLGVALWFKNSIILPVLSCLILLLCHGLIVRSTDPSNTNLGALTFPISIFMRFWLDYSSMFRYEFGVVEWKDRNICIPVMHTISHLPQLMASSQDILSNM